MITMRGITTIAAAAAASATADRFIIPVRCPFSSFNFNLCVQYIEKVGSLE